MAHPNVKLVVYLQYFGDKILDKPNALSIVRRDLVTLGIPHPKGTNVEFPARNAVQGYWLSHTGGILHKNLMVRIRENQPDRAALDEMSLSSLTLYEIFDDLSDEQPIVTPPSDSITFPPPRPSTSPHKRHHHHHHHESSSYTPQWQHKSASRQPYSSSSPVARKRRLSDAFSQHEFDSGSYRSGNGFGNRGSPSNRHPRVKIEEDCSSTSSIPMFPPASYQSRFAHPSEMPLGFEEPLTASGGLLERLVQNNPPHLEAQQALDAVNHALAVAKAKLMAAERRPPL
ncbi:hypothetical protein BDV98DRAFT_343781 [Pterulicium gracile]|uniref:Uncharacterized protein n=1 Tax=Pterulicium gracile TaxID=1884261 RepID=A0A5C3Q780_9AGAR|nr:hypothetical protein BDV98DRAFT_343781 [Pterula gracilis]